MDASPAAPARSSVGPWVLLTLCLLFINVTASLCWATDCAVASQALSVLRLAIIPVWWCLPEAECRPRGIRFPLDMGMFLYPAAIVVVPYYLWRALWKSVLLDPRGCVQYVRCGTALAVEAL